MINNELIRLQKYIADCGIVSRRKAEELIIHNTVMVNQVIVNELGVKINPGTDVVSVNGEIINPERKKVYIILNKPVGYVTTAKDEFNRKTVLELIDTDYRIYPVGRLDYDTSGLIILTNDGDFANKLMHPKYNIDKTYVVELKGNIKDIEIKKLQRGIIIDSQKTHPAKVELLWTKKDTCELKITIHEGRNRQIRKMCEAIDHKVIRLKRISLGNITLGKLKEGQWRYLSNQEVNYLKGV